MERLGLLTEVNDRRIELFDFNYREFYSDKIPVGYKTMNIGTISLYQTLERLWDDVNPYPSRCGVVGGPGVQWEFEYARKIEEYEKRFKELDIKKELSDEDRREIEITNQVYELFLEDYCFTPDNFEDDNKDRFRFNFNRTKSNLEKTLIKKQPNLTIMDCIKYI